MNGQVAAWKDENKNRAYLIPRGNMSGALPSDGLAALTCFM